MKSNVSKAVFLGPGAAGASGTVAMPWAAVSGGQPGGGAVHFTPRQLEVLALLCEGLPNKLICRRLNIASGTVKVHISCILRELGVTSRLQAVVAARGLGLTGNPLLTVQEQPVSARPLRDYEGAGAMRQGSNSR